MRFYRKKRWMEKERFGAPLYLKQSNLRSFIFSRSDSLIFFKSTDKIAEIIETIPVGNFRNRVIGGWKLVAGLFDSLPVQIIHRRLVCHFRKESAEIFGWHGHRGRKLLKSQRRCIIMFNKFQYLFQPVSYTHLDVYKRQRQGSAKLLYRRASYWFNKLSIKIINRGILY